MNEPETHVVNNLGMDLPESITELPGIRITTLGPDEPVPDELRAEALYTHTWGGGNVPELLTRGVRWVQVMGVGVDRFPLDILGEDQTLACARGATAIPIGEFAIAAMISHAKAMPQVWIDDVPETGWFSDQRISGLYGKTVVILGVGGIGSHVARLALAFGMRVIGVRRRDLPSPVDGMEVATDLAAVIGEADHLVIAAPATDDSHHMVNAELLAAATPGLHIVNVARGSLIDQDALRAALDHGTVACASLDTVDPEPLPAGHWLFTHPGVRLSPHVSWVGPGARTAMFDAFVDNYHRFRAGEPLAGVVDLQLGY
ncbi:MAG: NAD(P)-dependent oxidoreductase [Acidimicrobiales bacterium]|nr:NAD(P)-dependent oxidoreductase [Acidimicrobiales bacterium]